MPHDQQLWVKAVIQVIIGSEYFIAVSLSDNLQFAFPRLPKRAASCQRNHGKNCRSEPAAIQYMVLALLDDIELHARPPHQSSASSPRIVQGPFPSNTPSCCHMPA